MIPRRSLLLALATLLLASSCSLHQIPAQQPGTYTFSVLGSGPSSASGAYAASSLAEWEALPAVGQVAEANLPGQVMLAYFDSHARVRFLDVLAHDNALVARLHLDPATSGGFAVIGIKRSDLAGVPDGTGVRFIDDSGNDLGLVAIFP